VVTSSLNPVTANVPESDLPDLREYLFVDAPRVRMLVSQLQGGAPETTKLVTGRSGRLRANLKLLEGERASQRSEEDTIALSDLYVSMLEEDAKALGMLSDLSDRAKKPKFWKRGGLRRTLEPGMLLRVTAPTRLMDASALVRIWRSFEAASGDDDGKFEGMMTMVEALYGENLAVTVMPCGPSEPSSAFLGVIGHGTDCVALDRASLLSRIGPGAPELTTILQLARIPTERENTGPTQVLVTDIMRRIKAGGDSLDRSAFDEFLLEMMRMTEDHGLQSAPRWPAVAMTPLAIYRQMPAAPSLLDEGLEPEPT